MVDDIDCADCAVGSESNLNYTTQTVVVVTIVDVAASLCALRDDENSHKYALKEKTRKPT
jgi:hypothetical protein